MQNFNDLIVNTLIETSTENFLKIVSYEKTSENNRAKKIDEYAFNICHVAETVYFVDQEIKAYQGKNKKAFKIAQYVKAKLTNIISQVGKNDIKALKIIGENAETFYNEFQNSESKASSIRGFASIIKKDNPPKEIDEKITNFIKSNTTKKDDDGKMTIAELSKMFGEIAQKMLKENNKNIVDFLPTKEEIEKTG